MTHCNLPFHIETKPNLFQFHQKAHLPKSRLLTMASSDEFKITNLNGNDFDEWATLFRGYIDFYETTIPEEQYRKTFDRILDSNSDLYALVMRQQQAGSGNGKMIAIAHFFPQQTPWSEKKIMLLNGKLFISLFPP